MPAKKSSKGSALAKAGMPAKAGRRKLPNQKGKHIKPIEHKKPGFEMKSDTKVAIKRPSLAETIPLHRKVNELRRTNKMVSDPFMWSRMKAHIDAGILTDDDLPKAV